MRGNKLVAMMLVYNEADRFLSRSLDHLSRWVDKIVILDDGSTDDTLEICKQYSKVSIIQNQKRMFTKNEALIRAKLWQFTIQQNPDWILAIDADEIFTDRIIDEIDNFLSQKIYDGIAFRFFDFWKSEEYYRIDGAWNPWNRQASKFLVRYQSELNISWPNSIIHCGRLPIEYREIKDIYYSDIRIKHLGWVRTGDHYKKYLFYCQKDIEQYGQIQPHTKSVMDSNEKVCLEKWFERKRINLNI